MQTKAEFVDLLFDVNFLFDVNYLYSQYFDSPKGLQLMNLNSVVEGGWGDGGWGWF